MALLLSGRQIGTVTFRLIFFLPYILADVAAGLICRFVFDGDTAWSPASRRARLRAGLPAGQPQHALMVLVVVVWKYSAST